MSVDAVTSGSNLLCSDGGIELMPEICLRVVELLIQSNPKAVRCLNLVSKVRNSLISEKKPWNFVSNVICQ